MRSSVEHVQNVAWKKTLAQMIMKYKAFEDLMQEVVENLVEAYRFGFIGCKKIIGVSLQLNPGKIRIVGESEEDMESEDVESEKDEAVNAEEVAIETLVTEIIVSAFEINIVEESADPMRLTKRDSRISLSPKFSSASIPFLSSFFS